ncbi:MAG: ribosomal protein L11 methyltransferase [Arenicella sp.]|jgi:ribosomal protein L11 methyltransferase
MSWIQATFVVDAADVDKLSEMLEGFLAQAVTTENAGEDEFYEVAFPGTPDWQKVKLTALFNDTVELEPIISFVQTQFSSNTVGAEIPVGVARLVDQDWERVWLASFKPIQVGTDLWVCPSWCEPTEPSARNIVLDPGLAFGTGTHATTNMCLHWLAEQKLDGQRVLDYGSGSGILAIAAIMSDAAFAEAVDIDPLAVNACNENALRNNVDSQMRACLPQQLLNVPAATFDLVIANILADVIIQLRDTLLLHLKPGGKLLLTGILSTQADKVKAAFGDQFNFDQQDQDQWCLISARRK